MVTKSKAVGKKENKGRVKVGKLRLTKETLKELNDAETKKIRGGSAAGRPCYAASGGGCYNASAAGQTC